MLSREEIAEWLERTLSTHLGVAPSSVTPTALLEDLGATDEDLEDLAGFIEDDFEFTVEYEVLTEKDDLSVGDLIDIIERGDGD